MIEEAEYGGRRHREDASCPRHGVQTRKAVRLALQQREACVPNTPEQAGWLERLDRAAAGVRRSGKVMNERDYAFADDQRPRMFGENALWAVQAGVRRERPSVAATEAEQDLRQSVAGRAKVVHGREHLELGKR